MACIHGNDCRQGAHQDAQKSRYTTLPRNSARSTAAACAPISGRKHAHTSTQRAAAPPANPDFRGFAINHLLRRACDSVYFVPQSKPESSMTMFSCAATGRSRVLLLTLALAASSAHAGSGPFGIDHEWTLDQNGIWSRNVQNGLQFGVIAVEVTGSLWFGNDTALGHTFWQTVDASVISGIGATLLKRGSGRARPNQGGPNEWFKGSCCESFPSGEVTLQASF